MASLYQISIVRLIKPYSLPVAVHSFMITVYPSVSCFLNITMSLLYSNGFHSHYIPIQWSTFRMWWNGRLASFWKCCDFSRSHTFKQLTAEPDMWIVRSAGIKRGQWHNVPSPTAGVFIGALALQLLPRSCPSSSFTAFCRFKPIVPASWRR